MHIQPQQVVNPGVYEYDEKYKKQLRRFERAVERSSFLNEKEKLHWMMMGSILSTKQLLEAERIIIGEDLKRLHTRQKLSRLKPLKNNG